MKNKSILLCLSLALCVNYGWAKPVQMSETIRPLDTLTWKIVGNDALGQKLLGPTSHGGVMDTVTMNDIQYGVRFIHPGDGSGYKSTGGIYFYYGSVSRGDNFVELHVPGGVKARLAITFSTGSKAQSYNFFANIADATKKAPSPLYDTVNIASEKIMSFSRSSSSVVNLDTLDINCYNDSARKIIRIFHAGSTTGGRFQRITYMETEVNPLIPTRDTIEEYKEDTTHRPATDTLPDPLPTYNADFSKTIRILGIGNSFTVDLLEQHFVPLCMGEGLDVVVGFPYQGGTTIPEHMEYYKNNSKVYDYRKWENGEFTKTGTATKTLKDAIMDEPWDLVTLQSYGSFSYAAQSAGMGEMVDTVRTKLPTAKLCHHVTWCDAECGSLHGLTQDAATDSILNWGARNFNNFDFEYISPVGRAIQNARTSFLGDNLNRDCHHITTSEGRYIAALVFYEIVTGKSCIGVNYYPLSMTAYRAEVCQHAAHYAVLSPLKTTDMSKEYGVEKGADPLKSITVDGVQYSGELDTVYVDANNEQTTIYLHCAKDSSTVVATPKQGYGQSCTIELTGADGAKYTHTFTLMGAAFKRHMWNALSETEDVSPTQDSICTQKVLKRGECSMKVYNNGGNAGTGATTGFYLYANSESRPKTYIKLAVPGDSKAILNVVARLGTKLGNAVPPFPFYAYIQDGDKADPTTLYSIYTIGDAETLAFYPSLDNYNPLVMDGLYCNFTGKPAQKIFIYNTGNAERYCSIEYIILDTAIPTSLSKVKGNDSVRKMICGDQIHIIRGDKTYTTQGMEIK